MTLPTRDDRLSALAEETPTFEGRARHLDTANPVAAILDEIDAAVLPVTMRFETGTRSLALIVSGRRLHRISEGAPDEVLDTPLPVDNTALTEKAARVLETFADGADTLVVTHDAAPDDMDMSDRVSVTALADALGLGASDATAAPSQRFLGRMGDAITTMIHLDDWVAGDVAGTPSDLASLRIVLTTQLSTFVDTRRAKCASHSDPSLTLFADVEGADASIGLAVFGSQAILFRLPTAALPQAADTFRRII